VRATGDDFFTGNYAPVASELCSGGLAIQGTLPEELLGGVYLRNGPNPPFKPEGGYHWYEGDSMLVSTRGVGVPVRPKDWRRAPGHSACELLATTYLMRTYWLPGGWC
jgi:hypothetical protein